MIISKQRTIQELQEEFSSIFEGLSIEFYQSKHAKHTGSKEKDKLKATAFHNEINQELVSGEIILNSESTVAQFEEEMQKRFGLSVQVFRRSNDIYLQTITTDKWTLGTQNTKGINSLKK